MIDTATWYIFLQLLVAVVLGGLIGVEREYKGKPAGVKTYALVCLGSALFIILGQHFLFGGELARESLDPSRVLSAIVMGVGFLGGGLIIKRDAEVEGLTTAAGLWIAAAIGATIGVGLFLVAIFTTALTIFIFQSIVVLENKYIRKNKEKDNN